MKKVLFALLTLVFIGSFCAASAMALTAEDIVKTSALEEILKRGKLLVGLKWQETRSQEISDEQRHHQCIREGRIQK